MTTAGQNVPVPKESLHKSSPPSCATTKARALPSPADLVDPAWAEDAA
jgi:hypothetical protein